MTEDEVLDLAQAGAAAGCTEALFTLGDKPERRYRVARDELAALGCETTIDYLERCARWCSRRRRLPHLNPGSCRARSSSASGVSAPPMGIMLETIADRLGARGGPHWASPDKVPARRLETIDAAGELRVPFTSGILIGIGETREERLDALAALGALAEHHGHLQEVIVQNFREAGHAHGRASAGARRPPVDRGGAAAPRRRREHAGAPEPSDSRFPGLLDAGSTTGAASRR